MIDMRDQVLGGLAQTLGNLAQQTAVAFNAQSNANAAYPPPTSLTGRETGLLSTDSLGFTGKTTIAVTGANGNLVSRIDVDFGAGTLRVDGGPPASIGTTIASFTTALNGALGANGTASFIDGKLSIAANGTNGILVKDDATTPSQRGGAGFSQFFGLNDVFQSQMPSLTATGLSAGDPGGFAAGATITVALKGPDGDIGKTASITTTAGQTIGDIVNALNTAMGGAATFTLNSDGSISSSTSALYPGYSLDIPVDNSQRGTTGVSFSQLFGLGSNAQRLQAMGFAVTPAVTANPARLGFATANITSSTVAGDSIVSAGDNSGALALQNVITKSQSFHAAGGIAAQAASLSDYASTFYQNISTSSNTITANQTTQDDRLNEANARVASNSGVNLDEELMSLSSYQQAYAASARMLTVLDQLYKTLLDIQ
jgi:flagellar hook-associated protein 1 FlgK